MARATLSVLMAGMEEVKCFAVRFDPLLEFSLSADTILTGNTPNNLNPFLPASLDNIFPTKPPQGTYTAQIALIWHLSPCTSSKNPPHLNPSIHRSIETDCLRLITEDLPTYDLSITGSGSRDSGPDGGANTRAFGFLVLDGPSGAVHSLRKRDGSHWHVVSCEPMQESRATLQIVYLNNNPDSNCQGVHEGGVAGTIVAMPNECGPGE